jgi:Zn-dependent protease with chaperone function
VKRPIAAIAGLSLMVSSVGALAADYAAPPPGYTPDMASDEAGLWMQVDKAEAEIKVSPALIRDEALNKYVRDLVCKLAAEHCGSIRVYIMEVPGFNAYMMPNGAMVVWSGLLFRMENESQLALVLGHELTHYLHRHTLDQFRSMVNTAGAMVFVQVGMAAAGVGILSSLAQLAAAGGLLAHNREQERDADSGGFQVLTANGYDPRQAPAIWRYAADETNANPNHSKAMFFATHPVPEERMTSMAKRAEELEGTRNDWVVNAEPYHAATDAFLKRWGEDELARGEADESVTLFRRLAAGMPSRGIFQYFLAEAYRKRNAQNDVAAAQSSYRGALACADAPVEAWRGLGLVAMKAGDNAVAKDAFTQYRSNAPDAGDKAMIDFYLTQL